MSLKQNKDKTEEEKVRETTWAENQLGIMLNSFDPLQNDDDDEPKKNKKKQEQPLTS